LDNFTKVIQNGEEVKLMMMILLLVH